MIYEQYFSFNERPFSIAPNPHFLFANGQYKEALAVLEYGVHHRGGFVLLTGEVGTGKTTLAKHIVSHTPADTELALIIHSQLDRLALLQQICREFSVDCAAHSQESELIALLNEFLLSIYAKGGYSLLIIDEAQHLSFEALELVRLLTNLETNTEKLLQIILLGQPELKVRLNQYNLRQLNQRFTARFHLTSLTFFQVKKYIEYRLAVAGNPNNLFSWAALFLLARLSKGIPRLINVLADRCLMGCYALDRQQVTGWMVYQAAKEVFDQPLKSIYRIVRIAKFSLLIAALFFAGLYFNRVDLTGFERVLGDGKRQLSGEVLNHEPVCMQQTWCWQGQLPVQLFVGNEQRLQINEAGRWVDWRGQVAGDQATVFVTLPSEFQLSALIKVGNAHVLVNWVRDILYGKVSEQVDDYSTWQRIEPHASSAAVIAVPPLSDRYDKQLEAQVKNFQRKYALQVDGVIGMQTIAALYLWSEQGGF